MRLKQSCAVQNLPESPECRHWPSPNVKQRFQVQPGDDFSLTIAGDNEWSSAFHQNRRRMEIEVVRRCNHRSRRQLGVQVWKGFAADQFRLAQADKSGPDTR